MYWIIAPIYCIIFAFSCSYLAKEKGKNPISWAFIGFFTGIIGLLIIGFTPKKEKEYDSGNSAISKEVKENVEADKSENDEEVLLELTEAGILTEEEFNKKKEIINKKKELSIEKEKIYKRIEPNLNKLLELKEKGILTNEEFNIKKTLLIEKEKELIKQEKVKLTLLNVNDYVRNGEKKMTGRISKIISDEEIEVENKYGHYNWKAKHCKKVNPPQSRRSNWLRRSNRFSRY